MKGKRHALAVTLILSAVIIGGCRSATTEPAAVPTVAPTEAPPEPPIEEPTVVPTEPAVQAPDPAGARDAALAYVGQTHDQQVPGVGGGWMEVDITEEGLVGGSSRRYAADRWVVTVTFPVVAPSATIYQVVATNGATGFQWEGEVDAIGQVTELAVVEGPDVLFEGVSFSYDDTIATDVLAEVVAATGPAGPDRAEWEVEPEKIRFSFEGYVLPATFHEPRVVVYPVAEMEMVSEMGARIMAALRQALADRPEVAPLNPIVPPFNAGQLVSAQLAYMDFVNGRGFRFLTQMGQAYAPINNHELFYAFQGISDDGEWYVAAILPVAHPSLPADGSEIPGDDFGAFAENFESYAAEIAAQLNVEVPASFTPDLSLLDAMMASLKVAASEPAPAAGLPVVAWGGFVKGQPADGQFDDCLALEPEGAGEIGLSGADNTVEAQIQVLRDSGTYAHFWGTLNCPVIDCGGCELVVERLREDRPGPFVEPDPVEAWEGTIVSLPEGAQFDDYFVLAGEFPVGFGIEGIDAGLVAELMSLRDTGREVRIWGRVEAGIPDAFGNRILVTRLEVVGWSAAEAGWLPYTNEAFGYSLMYPADATLLEGTDGRTIQISGPLVDNERWPMIEVSYFDSEFYHPPAGTDLGLWIADHVPYSDATALAVEVAGLRAIRVTTEASPQAYGFDEYYVVNDGQLFRIAFIHTKGQQDWDLYGMFLERFSFD